MALAASSSTTTAFVFSDSSSRLALPKCSGLRLVKPRISSASISSSSSRFFHRRSSAVIVAEKPQDTLATVGVVTDKTWKELVLECKDIPVLVDFWAPWCGPCRMIAPIFEELAREYGGRIRCLKLNTDESPDVASQYGIRSIPTVMLFKGGDKKDTVIGAVPKTTLQTTIEKFL